MSNNELLFSTAMSRVREIFPNADADVDNYGQIILYTNTMLGEGAVLVPFVQED